MIVVWNQMADAEQSISDFLTLSKIKLKTNKK